MLLKDKVSIVTGSAQGIGKEIATLFAKEGSNIVLCDVNKEALEAAKNELESLGISVLAEILDVTDPNQVAGLVNKTLDKFARVDILINNAGITRDALLVRMKESDWDSVLAVNLKGAFNCIKSVAPSMMKARSGRIVNIASIIGLMGNIGQANYAASKGGLIALTKTAAKELAPRNINVNAIAPGFIQTAMTDKLPEDIKAKMLQMIPLGKFGRPIDVANATLFLCIDASSYITGQVIKVDGGMVM